MKPTPAALNKSGQIETRRLWPKPSTLFDVGSCPFAGSEWSCLFSERKRRKASVKLFSHTVCTGTLFFLASSVQTHVLRSLPGQGVGLLVSCRRGQRFRFLLVADPPPSPRFPRRWLVFKLQLRRITVIGLRHDQTEAKVTDSCMS